MSFAPTVGAEIRKTKPAVVIQNDIGNRHSPVTIVAAVTSRVGETLTPTEVPVTPSEGGLKASSIVLLNQVRTVDTRRLVRRLGRLGRATIRKVDHALLISLGLVEVS